MLWREWAGGPPGCVLVLPSPLHLFIFWLSNETGGRARRRGEQRFAPAAPPARRTRGGPGGRCRRAEPRTAPTGRTGSRRGNKIEREKRLRRPHAALARRCARIGVRGCVRTRPQARTQKANGSLGPGPAALTPGVAGSGLRRDAAGSGLLAPHLRFPQHEAPRSGADRGQTLAEALRQTARGPSGSCSSLRFPFPSYFFLFQLLLSEFPPLFSFISFLFSIAFAGASFLAFPFSFSLFSVLSLIPFF